MDNKTISAELRTELGKSASRKIRKEGRIPAVVYGHSEPMHISLDEKEFTKKLENLSESTIIELNVGKNSYSVLIKDFQDDILNSRIEHVDFFEIERGKSLKTNVPVHIDGTAQGVREGGVLEVRLHDLEVECLPKDIPAVINVDVTELNSGEAIHVADIAAPEGVKFLNMPEQTVVSVTLVKASVETAEGEEEGEAETEE